MSGFRDTFSKNDEEETLLNYDDSAFYYFAGTMLLVALLPWTYFTIKSFLPKGSSRKKMSGEKASHTSLMAELDRQEREQEKREFRSNLAWNLLRLLILLSFWALFFLIMTMVGEESQIRRFDPFDILGVEHGASDRDIKKAYHKLAKEYHPDKNPDDPLAQARFISIKKAYDCLTDVTAKANFEKYGNPDGPQTTKVGIGLPQWLLGKNNQVLVLVFFFALIIIIVPAVFIVYYNRTKKYAANGVLIETMQFLGYHINEGTRLKSCPELLAASAESRALPLRPSDNEHMVKVMQETTEHKKRNFNLPVIVRNQYLLWAHLQRKHHTISPELRGDLNKLLKHSTKLCQVMVEIACMREWFLTAQSIIEFGRDLVQALDATQKGSSLMQVPHFTEEQVRHSFRGKKAITNIDSFIKQEPAQRKGLADKTDEQTLDIEDFVVNFPKMTFEGNVFVEDEDSICIGDIVTVEFILTRTHLLEGETQGAVHAPFFPVPKFEVWWVFLLEPVGTSRILGFERMKSRDRVITSKIRFQPARPGKFTYELHALSDSYAGIDQKASISFTVKTEEDVKREFVVHKEDLDLDLQPTLFHQIMGGEMKEESEDEDEQQPEVKAQDDESSDSGSCSDDESDSD
eukprot:GEMP01014349.1.p1 GENE.GEMP01014349.1~~GEMP01014349.1.p1  ORF type:complete len:631 (+),score=99.65 GEMP01014349.1:151-2043(+)